MANNIIYNKFWTKMNEQIYSNHFNLELIFEL